MKKLLAPITSIAIGWSSISVAGIPDVGLTICDEMHPCSVDAPRETERAASESLPTSSASPRGIKGARKSLPGQPQGGSNLPVYFRRANWADFVASEHALQAKAAPALKVVDLRAGDILHAVIEHELEVWPGADAPVRAIITRGKYKGSYLLGEARLDASRKRALIDFVRLRTLPSDLGVAIQIKGVATGVDGRLGLLGDYHSESGKFMFAQIFAAAAAGFTDATIQRQQNTAGNWVQEPSVETAAKSGVATALSKRADRWAQQESSAPEWTEVGAFREIRVVLKQDAQETTQ